MQEIERKWSKNHTFKFIPVLSEEAEDSDWDGPRGFVTDHFKNEYLSKGVVTVDDMKAFFCGPPVMIDLGIEALQQAGLAESDIYFDKFEDARSPAPVIDNTKCVLCDECLMVKPTPNCLVEATNFKVNGGGNVQVLSVCSQPKLQACTTTLFSLMKMSVYGVLHVLRPVRMMLFL